MSIAPDVVCEVLRIVGWALHSVVRSRPRADSWRQRDLGQYAQYPRGRSRGQQKRSDPSARWHFGLVLVRRRTFHLASLVCHGFSRNSRQGSYCPSNSSTISRNSSRTKKVWGSPSGGNGRMGARPGTCSAHRVSACGDADSGGIQRTDKPAIARTSCP